eukprot:7381940-Prymnesium_polylepis.1
MLNDAGEPRAPVRINNMSPLSGIKPDFMRLQFNSLTCAATTGGGGEAIVAPSPSPPPVAPPPSPPPPASPPVELVCGPGTRLNLFTSV